MTAKLVSLGLVENNIDQRSKGQQCYVRRRHQCLSSSDCGSGPRSRCCFDGCINSCVEAVTSATPASGATALETTVGGDSMAANVHSALYNYFYG